MKRNRSLSRMELDHPFIDRIEKIKAEHPLWGYRRVWAYIRYRDNIVVGKNRIYRLMSEHQKLVTPDTKLKAKQSSNRKEPRAKIPNQFWGMPKTSDWLKALNRAVQSRFPNGIHFQKGKTKLITDNGCQPTSKAFMQACSTLKIKQIFSTWNNPKGYADTERVFRTMKEDLVWTHEWHLPFEFQSDLDAWILAYNTDFPHQSLNYKTPAQFNQVFVQKKT